MWCHLLKASHQPLLREKKLLQSLLEPNVSCDVNADLPTSRQAGELTAGARMS